MIAVAVQCGVTYGSVMPDFKPRDPHANFRFGTELSSHKNKLFDFLEEEISHKVTYYQTKKISVFTLNYNMEQILAEANEQIDINTGYIRRASDLGAKYEDQCVHTNSIISSLKRSISDLVNPLYTVNRYCGICHLPSTEI